MKKTIRYVSLFAIVLAAVIIIPLFASCSASSGNYAGDMMDDMEIAPEKGEPSGGVSYAPDASIPNTPNETQTTRKIIRTFTVHGETKEYDVAVSAINSSIAARSRALKSTQRGSASLKPNGIFCGRYPVKAQRQYPSGVRWRT